MVAGLGAALILASVPAEARPLPPVPPLPVSVAVAVEGGRAVREAPWIEAQLAEVERLLGPFGVHFRRTAPRILPDRYAHLETREDRDALDAERLPGVVNVFVVASLRDVDDTSLYRMGVHWRHRAHPSHRYAIVTAEALVSTFAHELGHYLGLNHTQTLNNLMSYHRDGAAVFLTRGQGATIRANARLLLASGEVGAAPELP
jgi:hypothetical protein